MRSAEEISQEIHDRYLNQDYDALTELIKLAQIAAYREGVLKCATEIKGDLSEKLPGLTPITFETIFKVYELIDERAAVMAELKSES